MWRVCGGGNMAVVGRSGPGWCGVVVLGSGGGAAVMVSVVVGW